MQHVRSDERIKLLSGVWLFERCTKKGLAALARMATPVIVEPGRVLAREGAPGHEFVVVVEGTASTTSRGEEVGQVGPGSFFGELALLDGGPRTATVRALTPMLVLVLDRAEFNGSWIAPFRRWADGCSSPWPNDFDRNGSARNGFDRPKRGSTSQPMPDSV